MYASGTTGKCLSDINDARQAAGLSDLIQATTANTLPLDVACPFSCCFQKNSVTTIDNSVKAQFVSGTYAFYLADSDTIDCDPVLKKWKNAYKNFEGMPPTYSEGAPVYKSDDNVSLIAMYNPSPNATADCRVVTCTKTVDSPSSVDKGYALMCLTAPDALNKRDPQNPPFS